MIPLCVSVDIYTSCVIYLVQCVTILHANIPCMAKHTTAMNGTRIGTNVQLTFVIHQQVTYKSLSNSVHNSENYTLNALINSHINYQGNGLIAHVIKIF